jgi:hypothetical protein
MRFSFSWHRFQRFGVYSAMRALTFCLCIVTLFGGTVQAQPQVHAVRLGGTISIDGRLQEEGWAAAEAAGNFRQTEPKEGEAASERTEVRFLYDATSIYVGARLYDSEAGKIVARLSRRDATADADRFTLYLDPYHDHLTGAFFEVSAAGVQRDAVISNDTSQDDSWDGVWESAVTVQDDGWTVELRIPLSQLRFAISPQQTWGFNASRFIYRKNETDWFELVPRDENGLASRMAHLTDLDNMQARRNLEVIPYAVNRGDFIRPPSAADPFNDGSRLFGSSGVDLKYALRSNIVLNATVNPDFGQVEIDPAVVNLGAFETYYPEKRPFFVEGIQVFNDFGRGGTTGTMGFNRSEPDLFHTRRIGRRPQASVSADYVDEPNATTILGAAKLTGKTATGWTFATLEALTSREYATTITSGERSRSEVEPLTNYFAARILKQFGGGRSGVGLLTTDVQRQLRAANLRNELPEHSSVFGFDAYHQFDKERRWVAFGKLSWSRVRGSSEAIGILQREPQRYFQRPDASHVRLDPAATSLKGWTGSANLNRNSGGWTVNSAVWATSPGFESSDLGFHFNGDVWGTHTAFDWKQLHPDRMTRSRNITVAKAYVWNYGRQKLTDAWFVFGGMTFNNYWNVSGFTNNFKRALDDRLTRGGPVAESPAGRGYSLNLSSDYRKMFVAHADAGRDTTQAGGWSNNAGISLEWKPSPRINLSSGPSYSISRTIAQYVTTHEDSDAVATFGKRYVFADLHRSQLTLETRVNVLFAPKASLQIYLQPLVSVGDYSDFKELARPASFDFVHYTDVVEAEQTYTARANAGAAFTPFDFRNPDFNFKSMRLNAIFRWEWRLGSTFFLAWTQQRTDLQNPGQFQLGRDLGRVFTGRADNVFLAKVTYWFSR